MDNTTKFILKLKNYCRKKNIDVLISYHIEKNKSYYLIKCYKDNKKLKIKFTLAKLIAYNIEESIQIIKKKICKKFNIKENFNED